ncbi:hypothetical protein DRQ25_09555, partial [Candidatus Fermentibacteria bacterium]
MAWLDGFGRRLKLTIPDEKIDDNLTDFPVMINLTDSSGVNNYDTSIVFDSLSGDNKYKIAVTTASGVVQCPIEIEYWDSIERKAVLWTKLPAVYSGTDTDFYLYYDATASGNDVYVGETADEITFTAVGTAPEETCSVIKDGSTYKMWYAKYDTSNYDIFYRTSTDGINWGSSTEVVSHGQCPGGYANNYAIWPSVIKDGSTYKMYYTGYNGSLWQTCYCDSTDGITWANHQLTLSVNSEGTHDTSRALQASVVKVSSTYHMLYAGYDGSRYRIIHCTSTDAINWGSFQMVMDAGANCSTPILLYDEDELVFKTWFNSDDPTWYSTSSDGINWSSAEYVFSKGREGTYDTVAANHTVVVKDGNEYKMWYTARDASVYRIIYAGGSYNELWKTPSQNVWDDNFVGVYHLNQDPSNGNDSILDSTSNGNYSTVIQGSMTSTDLITGRIGKCIEFDGSDDEIHTPGTPNSVNNNFAYSGWFKATTTRPATTEANSGVTGTSGQRYALRPAGVSDSGMSLGTNGISVFEHAGSYLPSVAVYNANIGTEFNHITIVYNDRTPTIYLNGVAVHTGLVSGRNPIYLPAGIGGQGYGRFPGQIDEVRYFSADI